jgi:glycerol-3-phosphate dehydrogenase
MWFALKQMFKTLLKKIILFGLISSSCFTFFVFANCVSSKKKKHKKTVAHRNLRRYDNRQTVNNSSTKQDKQKKQVLKDQRFYLAEARRYYQAERFNDAYDMCKKVIDINSKTKYAQQARKMQTKLKKIIY